MKMFHIWSERLDGLSYVALFNVGVECINRHPDPCVIDCLAQRFSFSCGAQEERLRTIDRFDG